MSKILVVGDVMLDKYIIGSVDRVSPEAPVPILDYGKTKYLLGGAGNVACQLKRLGVDEVCLVGVVGRDKYYDEIENILEIENIENCLHVVDDRPTTLKVRMVDKDINQIMRLDVEDSSDISNEIEEYVSETVSAIIDSENLDILIISDYNKGLFVKEDESFIMEEIMSWTGKIIADPKKQIEYYTGVDIVTPNLEEVGFKSLQELMDNKEKIDEYINDFVRSVIVTCGSEGIVVFTHDKEPYILKPIKVMHNKIDVTGAGDFVIAAIASSLCSGKSIIDAASYANHVASVYIQMSRFNN